MKHRVASLVVGLSVALGSAMVAPSAPAFACDAYSGCVDTTTRVAIPASVDQGQRVLITVAIASNASNAQPRGVVTVVITPPSNARAAEHRTAVGSVGVMAAQHRARGGVIVRTYKIRHGRIQLRTPRLTRIGTYRVRVVFDPKRGSVYNRSVTRRVIVVS